MVFFMYISTGILIVSAELERVSECSCILKYNCQVTGDGFTVWEGSAFECTLIQSNPNRIVLSHSEFKTSGSRISCNGGAIQAYNLSFVDSNYTSQLSVNATPEFIGSTVNCGYRSAVSNDVTNLDSTVIEFSGMPLL